MLLELQVYTFQKRKLEVELHPKHFLFRGWTRGKDGPPYTLARGQHENRIPHSVVKVIEARFGLLERLEVV